MQVPFCELARDASQTEWKVVDDKLEARSCKVYADEECYGDPADLRRARATLDIRLAHMLTRLEVRKLMRTSRLLSAGLGSHTRFGTPW